MITIKKYAWSDHARHLTKYFDLRFKFLNVVIFAAHMRPCCLVQAARASAQFLQDNMCAALRKHYTVKFNPRWLRLTGQSMQEQTSMKTVNCNKNTTDTIAEPTSNYFAGSA